MTSKALSLLLICSISFLLLLFLFPASNAHLLRTCNFPAIYQLGDSISDTGNLVQEDPVSVFGRLPYGQDFIKKATGRCSNGLLIIDYLAQSAGIPLLDPYLNLHANSSWKTGVNFAVAGSTALSVDFLAKTKGVVAPVTNSSLDVQLQWMFKHFNTTCFNIEKDCAGKLENSLFMLGTIGGNDYNYAFFQGKTIDEVKSMVPDVIRAIKDAVKRVIEYGVTRVVVPGNFPIGCLPIYLSGFQTNDSNAYDEYHCLKGLNDFSKYHNEHLKQAIKDLQIQHPNVAIIYGDYYNAYKEILPEASLLGFESGSLQKACCGSGGDYNFSLSKLCGAPNVTVCANPNDHLSWDGIHSTQKAYYYMAQWLIRDIIQNLRCIG